MRKIIVNLLVVWVSSLLIVGCVGVDSLSSIDEEAAAEKGSEDTGLDNFSEEGAGDGNFSEEDGEEEDTEGEDVGSSEENFFYFSYDDSASTSGVELVKYYLKNGQKPDSSWGRSYEFLNYEEFDRLKISYYILETL